MILKGKTQQDIDRQKKNDEAQCLVDYLDSTDWYAVRFAETGKAIPEDVILARKNTRERISELKEST